MASMASSTVSSTTVSNGSTHRRHRWPWPPLPSKRCPAPPRGSRHRAHRRRTRSRGFSADRLDVLGCRCPAVFGVLREPCPCLGRVIERDRYIGMSRTSSFLDPTREMTSRPSDEVERTLLLRRCRTISNSSSAPAVAAFRDATRPAIGKLTSRSTSPAGTGDAFSLAAHHHGQRPAQSVFHADAGASWSAATTWSPRACRSRRACPRLSTRARRRCSLAPALALTAAADSGAAPRSG